MTDAPDWVTLTDGEQLVWRGRPTLYAYMGRIVGGLLIGLIGVVVWQVTRQGDVMGIPLPSALPYDLIGGAVVLLGLARVGGTMLKWWSIRFLVTSDEVYRKQGILSRSVKNLRHDQIQNTSFSQSILGRLLSFGHVRIKTAGTGRTEMAFTHVPDPEGVVDQITRQIDQHRS